MPGATATSGPNLSSAPNAATTTRPTNAATAHPTNAATAHPPNACNGVCVDHANGRTREGDSVESEGEMGQEVQAVDFVRAAVGVDVLPVLASKPPAWRVGPEDFQVLRVLGKGGFGTVLLPPPQDALPHSFLILLFSCQICPL